MKMVDQVNVKIYDVTTWLTNSCNIYNCPITPGAGYMRVCTSQCTLILTFEVV